MNRRWGAAVAAVVAGIVIASGLTIVTLSQPIVDCTPGPVVATVNGSLTPRLLLNAPYNGLAYGTVPIDNGSQNLTIFANNSGGVWGLFEHVGWTIRQGVATGQSNSSCRRVYFPSLTDDWTSVGLPLFNSSAPAYLNDSAEANWVQINGTPGPVYFSNGFYAPTGQISTCGQSATHRAASSDYLQIGVQFDVNDVAHVVNVTLAVSTQYEYVFPANGGTWAIDNLSAPGGPGGGWAFSYSPC
jgi:hypothetical protein